MPLFGREAERKDLGALIDGPEDRSGILIQGSARIGKTALVDEAAAAAAPRDTCPEAPSAPGVQAIARVGAATATADRSCRGCGPSRRCCTAGDRPCENSSVDRSAGAVLGRRRNLVISRVGIRPR